MPYNKTLKFEQALRFYNTSDFKKVLKEDIQNSKPELLPLQQGLSLSSYVSKKSICAVILNTTENNTSIEAKVGIFYGGIIAGCSCSDDPTPQDEQNEYCELQFSINKISAETSVALITD